MWVRARVARFYGTDAGGRRGCAEVMLGSLLCSLPASVHSNGLRWWLRCGSRYLQGFQVRTDAGAGRGAGNFEGTALEYKLQNTKMVRAPACAHAVARVVLLSCKGAAPSAVTVNQGKGMHVSVCSQHKGMQNGPALTSASANAPLDPKHMICLSVHAC